MVSEIKISIREKSAVSRMVILYMEGNKFFIGKISDVFGITARVKLVLSFLKEVLVDFVHKRVVWVRHRPFHFVIDNSFVFKATLWVICCLKLESVSFLSEVKVV